MSNNSEFFSDKKPAAVFKHGIISRYPLIFFSKTGSISEEGRGVYFDAFAGPGRYSNGEKGSPVIALDMATTVQKFGREITCVFTEKNSAYAEELAECLAEQARLKHIEVHNDEAIEQVDHVLDLADGLPLLSFLDPFGTALPFEVVTQKLLRKTRNSPTELLINFNVSMFWRSGGLAAKHDGDPKSEASLQAFDTVVGGRWWRDFFSDYTKDDGPTAPERARNVAKEYAKRVRETSHYSSIMTPVRRSPTTQPIFYLILFFRHVDAAWAFVESHSKALEEWRRTCFLAEQKKMTGTFDIFPDLEEVRFKSDEDQLKARWIAEIKTNLEKLVSERTGTTVSLASKIEAVYGETLGAAREMHLRAAWKELARDGLVLPIPRGNRCSLHKLSMTVL
ncbi:three-Cys-motif partner protein TcmP [Actinomyces provencensis]|uniref:three-Cys-motif partner protein TcmP n=1 Tax=Actinomyces provencensis TaxID=1720198 RepID=UPI00096A5FE4|nr:three-Cys-motif partner protein TcmP [Actinomyces provencensis]